MDAPASITITPVLVADLLAEDERMPVYVHGGDVAVWFGELDEPHTEGHLRVRARARAVATPHRPRPAGSFPC
jgi:hypothetical protein